MSHSNHMSLLVATAVASSTAVIVARNHSKSRSIRNTGQLGFVDVEKIGWCEMGGNLCRICVLTSRNNLSCDTLQQTMQMLGP